jgi:hypothetical protein
VTAVLAPEVAIIAAMQGNRCPRGSTAVAAFAGLLTLLAAATAFALPPGTHRPGLAEASEIIKFSGDTTNCLNVVVDTRSPKWALVEWKGGRGCPASASFAGFTIVYESAPQNLNTVGVAWTRVLKTAHPRCPLPKVPASVARTFQICVGSSHAGHVPVL